MKKIERNSKGFTIIETLLIIIFFLLASSGVFIIYENVQVNHRVNQETRYMDEIRTGVKSLYGSAGNYDGISNQILNYTKVIPPDMQTEGIPTSVTNSFGRAVVVLPFSFNGTTSNAFSIVYLRVPIKICTKLINMVGMQFLTVTIGSTIVKTAGQREIDLTTVSSVCAGTGSDVDIMFTST